VLFPRERSVFFCEAGNRSIDLQVQRIRIILCSVKLRVLNPKLQKQRYIREIKKTTHHRQSTQTSSRMFASSRAQVVVSPPKKVRAFIVVVSSFGFGRRLLRRGCPVDDDGIFLLSCLLFAFRDCLSSSSSSVVVCVRDREKLYPF